jgi:hypothetical protein
MRCFGTEASPGDDQRATGQPAGVSAEHAAYQLQRGARPAWFTGANSQGNQFLYYQTDFLWELPFIDLIRSTDGGA